MILNRKREEREAEMAEDADETPEAESAAPTYLPDACSSCGSFTLYLDEADQETVCDTCGQVGKVEAEAGE